MAAADTNTIKFTFISISTATAFYEAIINSNVRFYACVIGTRADASPSITMAINSAAVNDDVRKISMSIIRAASTDARRPNATLCIDITAVYLNLSSIFNLCANSRE